MPAPDLHTRAARFFLLAGQTSRSGEILRRIFWEMSAPPAGETAAHLPSLAAAVRKEYDNDAFLALALHPLPGVLPPEAVPWHDRLVNSWELHRTSRNVNRREYARRALVQLDGCGMPEGMQRPSRLPEWLVEARRMVRAGVGTGYEPALTGQWRVASGKRQMEKLEALETLAALAAWRPARGVITPPETLREWVTFWQEIRRSKDPLLKGIATRALLNLPEADLRAASLNPVPPEQLLRDLAAAIPAVAKRKARTWYEKHLLMLDWQPVEGNTWPAAGVAKVARAWLKVALHDDWWCRQMAWQQLVRWDRAGSLAPCGIDLLPFLVEAAQTEENNDVLWEMARWKPAAEAFTGTEKPDGLDLLRELEAHWQPHRQSSHWLVRASAWLAGIRLHQAGLASEPPDSFREAYLAAVAQEDYEETLSVLAQWSPDAGTPAALHRKWRQGWQSRLEEKNEWIPQAAAFALLHQALGNESGEGLRRAALKEWRTGTKEGQATKQIPGAALSLFHEVRAELAAGRVPDFKEKPAPPAQRQYPRLALPPGHIADRKWEIENEKLRIEN